MSSTNFYMKKIKSMLKGFCLFMHIVKQHSNACPKFMPLL